MKTTITEMVKAIQEKEQKMLMHIIRENGEEAANGYEIHFESNAPYIACYVDDVPCDVRVLAVRTTRNRLQILVQTEGIDEYDVPLYDIFAGQLEYIIDAC